MKKHPSTEEIPGCLITGLLGKRVEGKERGKTGIGENNN
jgi:hypothetical protein